MKTDQKFVKTKFPLKSGKDIKFMGCMENNEEKCQKSDCIADGKKEDGHGLFHCCCNSDRCNANFSAIAILDNDGNRILGKYYDKCKFPTLKEQTKFEKLLFRKTVKVANEIIMLDGLTILYRSSVDIYMYVMGSSYENELILLSALDCLFNSLNSLLRKEFEKRLLAP